MISIILLYSPCKAAPSLAHRLKMNANCKSEWGEKRRRGKKRKPEALGFVLR